jgi:hypothetical protein
MRKPRSDSPFRAHPSPDFALNCWTLIDREEGRFEDIFYLVMPAARGVLSTLIKPVKIALCYDNGSKSPFLWPIKLPTLGVGRGNGWSTSAMRIWEAAKTEWVHLIPGAGGYVKHFPYEAIVGEPVWPEQDFDDLLIMGFEDNVIDTPDHPVARRRRTRPASD